MQTILGAGGVIGDELAKVLTEYTDLIRIVSRNPKKVNDTDEIFAADLTDPEQVSEAVKGSDVTYLVAGLKYEIKVWRDLWPKIMANVIEACKKHQSKLVFFDNVYMYGIVDGIMTEETPVNPCSKKGEVRAQIADMLLSEVRSGNLKALIARAADFYGPNVRNSIPEGLIIQNYKKGKSAQVFCSDQFLHSYTFTPDAGKATAILGNTEKAYGQVWHLPTMNDPMTGKEFINAFAREFKVKPKYMVLKKWMIRIFGLFTPVIGEVYEMLYQYDRDYIFDSTKFEKEFNFQPTSYVKGIQLSVEAAK
jgi:nucleoside-diphosphate-sugar epimerase